MTILSRSSRGLRAACGVVACLALMACGGSEPPYFAQRQAALEAVSPEATDIAVELGAIPGLRIVREVPVTAPGVRFFVLDYDQPVDHANPGGERFRQRMTLLHRDTARPMVLFSTGYNISTRPGQSEPTALLQANQIMLEHRFFGPSTPASRDWTKLTVAQAAADAHRIVQAFKPLYGGKWLSTGGSKGGMTSIYHRYFYPSDVDATVPYVAPTSSGTADPRYDAFLARVGDPECRRKLWDVQGELLARRETMRARLQDHAAEVGDSFEYMGLDRALEFAVVELPFAFWQYGNASECATVPPTTASDAELFDYLAYVNDPIYLYGDAGLDFYAAYYWQSATELGGPSYGDAHVLRLLRYPGEDVPAAYPPYEVAKVYDGALIADIERWVRTHGERMLFIYGENDPWSAGAYDVLANNDSLRFFVPAGNHGSHIRLLPDAERAQALDALSRWAGVPVTDPVTHRAAAPADQGLEDQTSDVHRLRL